MNPLMAVLKGLGALAILYWGVPLLVNGSEAALNWTAKKLGKRIWRRREGK